VHVVCEKFLKISLAKFSILKFTKWTLVLLKQFKNGVYSSHDTFAVQQLSIETDRCKLAGSPTVVQRLFKLT